MSTILTNVRYSYCNVYEPRQRDKSKPDKGYSVALILETPEAETAAREAMRAAAVEKWGTNAENVLKQLEAKGKVCLKVGDTQFDKKTGEIQPAYKGKMFVSANCTEEQPPKVYNRYGQRVVGANQFPDEEVTKKRYLIYKDVANSDMRGPRSGDFGDAMIRIWAQDNDYGQRINCQLLGLAFRKEGDPLGRGEMGDDDMIEAFGGFEDRPIVNMME